MRVKKPALHPMVRPALGEIQAAGVEVTPEIVVWLQDAALNIRKTPNRPSADIVDFPTQCGGVWLYPLSFGAVEWVTQLPKRLQNDTRVLAFACANSRNVETLSKIRGTLAVTLAVSKWVIGLTCSLEALAVTVDRLIGCEGSADVPDHTERRKNDDDWEWGAVIKSLCVKYPGTSPDSWIWGVSRDKAITMISAIQQELPDDIKFTDYEITATNEFRSIVEAIKAGTYVG
jgi:hypothetical protein